MLASTGFSLHMYTGIVLGRLWVFQLHLCGGVPSLAAGSGRPRKIELSNAGPQPQPGFGSRALLRLVFIPPLALFLGFSWGPGSMVRFTLKPLGTSGVPGPGGCTCELVFPPYPLAVP